MKLSTLIIAVILFCGSMRAQHCAPINSYLKSIDLSQSKKSIQFNLTYYKEGGQRKASYQIYLLGYFKKDEAKIYGSTKIDPINHSATTVLHTQLVNENTLVQKTKAQYGQYYDFDITLNMDDLAKKMIAFRGLNEKDQYDNGGWKGYKEDFVIAVYIPFLESNHANLPGLPDYKHECTYRQRELLFRTLPYSFRIKFGVVDGKELRRGTYTLSIY